MQSETFDWETRRYVCADGVSIVADVGGEETAPIVVLMHGGGQTRHSWSDTMRILVDVGYRVINYDARGHGESGWSGDGRYPFSLRAADLETVLDGASRPFALVGASMGGITTLEAIGSGLRPTAAVLVDIVLRPERSGVERVRAFMAANPDGFVSLEEAVMAVAAYNPNRSTPGDPRKLMRNLRLGPDGRLRWHWDPRMVPADVTQDLEAMAAIIGRLPSDIDFPVLLVRGLKSDVLSETSIEDFRRYLRRAEICDVPSAGHMVAGDNNEVFSRRVVDFLARYLPTDPGARSANA